MSIATDGMIIIKTEPIKAIISSIVVVREELLAGNEFNKTGFNNEFIVIPRPAKRPPIKRPQKTLMLPKIAANKSAPDNILAILTTKFGKPVLPGNLVVNISNAKKNNNNTNIPV